MYRQTETLASFLPRWQLDLLAGRPGLPGGPVATHTDGAVLFIDVSGFTTLTREFARHGHRGAEQLSRVIDGIFGPVTDIVSSHGGDVIIFAGDSAIAVWRVTGDEPLAAVTARAAGAARVIQSRRFQSVDDASPILLRATIGAGELRSLELGGVQQQWQFMIDGDALSQVVACDAVAEPGSVTLSLPAWSLLRDHATASPVGTVAMRLEQLDHPPSPIGEFRAMPRLDADIWPSVLPGVVCQRIPEGHVDWLAEFRTVSVAVMSLDRDSRDIDRLDEVVRCMQETVLHFEGQVYQCLVDDKGTNLLAAFGLPPYAHEDDAERCLLAALNVRARLSDLGIDGSAGVATGRLWCGLYGSRERRQYSIVGPAINLASRLMQQSAGRILCDPATAEASRSVVCREVGEVAVKGYDSKVLALEVTDMRQAEDVGSSPAAFIGRQRELATIRDACTALAERGEPAFVLVEGEAGLGKSTLLARAMANVPGGIACYAGACETIDTLRPYAAWTSVLRQLLGLESDDLDADRTPDRVLEILGRQQGRDAYASLLNVALQTAFEETAATERLTAELRAARTRALIHDLVAEAANRQALVIVLEGGHWFDSHSWSLVEMVANSPAPLIMVVSSRPLDPRPAALDAVLSGSGSRHIALSPLTSAESQDLIRQLLEVDEVPDEIARVAVERAAGHPLFTEQIVLALREAGVFDVVDGRCVLLGRARDREQAAQGVSMTLGGVVLGRVDGLSSSQQLVIKTASVIGMRFTSPLLAAVHPADRRETLLDDLEVLVARRFIRRIADEAGSYEFDNVLIRDVMYESIPFQQRQEVHHAVARWFEDAGYADRPTHWPVLGYHYQHAEITDAAARYFDKAGTHAFAEHANAEAVRYLGEALELYPEEQVGEHGELQVKHGLANVAWSRYEDGRKSLERGLAALDRSLPETGAGSLVSTVAQLAAQLLRRRRSAAANAPDRDLRLQVSRGYEGLVEAYFIDGLKLPCLYCAVRALNVAEAAGPSAELARGYASMSALFGMMRLERPARNYKARALETAAAVNDSEARVWTLLSVGIYKLGNAAWEEAEASLEEAAELSAAIQHPRREHDCRISLSNLYLFRGQVERAELELDRCEELAGRSHDVRAAAAIVRNRILCLAIRSDRNALKRIEPQLRPIFDPNTALIDSEIEASYALRAFVALHGGHRTTARDYADRALAAIVARGADAYIFALDIVLLAEVYLAQDNVDLGQLAVLERTARRHARTFPLGQPVHLWLSGRLEAARERHGRSRRQFTRCAARADRLAMPYFAALAHIELSRLESDPQTADAHMAAAREHLEPLGLDLDHARV